MRCINTVDKSYTGEENTPLGLGYSASVEKVGTKMTGRDGDSYVVKKYKNGKRWVLEKKKTSPKMLFSKSYGGLKVSKHFFDNGITFNFPEEDININYDSHGIWFKIKGKYLELANLEEEDADGILMDNIDQITIQSIIRKLKNFDNDVKPDRKTAAYIQSLLEIFLRFVPGEKPI